MSLFIRLDVGFWSNRKTIKLRAKLGDAALWLMPRLWCYCATNQPDGIFESYTPEELAIAVGYSGDAKTMLEAMLEARFMHENPLRVNGWAERNAYHERYAERARKAADARWGSGKEEKPPLSPQEKKDKKERGDKREREEKCSEHCLEHAPSIEQASKAKKTEPFIPPTKEEALAFAKTIGLSQEDATVAFYHYQAKGWKLGKTPMKDWNAAFHGWLARIQKEGNGTTGTAYTAKPSTRPDPHARARPWVYKPARDLLQEQLDKMDAEGKSP